MLAKGVAGGLGRRERPQANWMGVKCVRFIF